MTHPGPESHQPQSIPKPSQISRLRHVPQKGAIPPANFRGKSLLVATIFFLDLLTLHIPTWRFWPQRYEILENLYLVGSGGSWHSLLNHVTSNPSPCISDPHLTAPAASFLLPPRAETSWQLVLHQNGEGSPTKTVNYSSLMIGQLVQLTRLTTFLIFLADISVVLRGMTGLCRLTCEGHVGSWNPGPRAMTRQLAVVVPIVEDRPLANGFLAGPFCLRHILETHNIYIYIQYVDIEYVIIYMCVYYI